MNPFTMIAARCYASVVAIRNRGFDRGRRVRDVDRPVISVGNLTMGGTGKTPTVQWIVRFLQSQGRRPIVALRGYGVAKGQQSDEAIEHENALDGVPVLANPDRVAAISACLERNPDRDVVVLDDGFQHRFVARQMDLVLIDARRPLAEERLLPVGRMREPLSSLARATDVLVTHATHVAPELADQIRAAHGRPPVAWCNHVWTGLARFDGDGLAAIPVTAIDGMRLVTRFGVAAAGGVVDQIRHHGGVIVKDVPRRDHAVATPVEVQQLSAACESADALCVTAKDWVKLRPLIDWTTFSAPIVVPTLALSFVSGEDALKQRILGTLASAESS